LELSRFEFQTTIDHDTIALPEEYQGRITGHVRVIVITDAGEDGEDMVE
jgi:hypothetical protein